MSERDALYRAVCSHPHDDTPRRVFAELPFTCLDEYDYVECFNVLVPVTFPQVVYHQSMMDLEVKYDSLL